LTEAVSIKRDYRTLVHILEDQVLIDRLQRRDEAAFELVFKANYKSLHAYAFTVLRDEAAAEEVVQHVFLKLWERSASIQISGTVTAYLYRAVYNASLNQLKHLKIRTQHRQFLQHRPMESNNAHSKDIHVKELEAKIAAALQELPEQCRTIFQLSRFEELRYREIAERLQISVKTVENQMGKALKLLRIKLAEFFSLISIFL
jgi:RNA polymerase sigma-70 factor (ECF subfamily)